MHGNVLVVDDQASMCDMIETDLQSRGFSTESFHSASEALQRVEAADFDVVLTDIRMPGVSGLQLCREIADLRADVPVIVMTAFGSMETAIDALRAGAYDFVTKPIEMEMLALILQRAIDHRRLQQQVSRLSQLVADSQGFGTLIGESPPMRELYQQLQRIADSEASVLVTGESGTGKELVAQSIHQNSRRADGPFIALNCAALPETLLESELFGHSPGAFTDARQHRKGLFQRAQAGTLLLDEIGEMPLNMQAKLLRVLEEGAVRPLGQEDEIKVDVRIISATNRDLETAVEEGRFREDLYYRINVVQLDLPPLRARGTDILTIAGHFLTQFAKQSNKEITGITEKAAEKLLAYSWPGNVRELRNVVQRAVALTQFDHIQVEDLPEKVRTFQASQVIIGSENPAELVPLEEIEKRYILHVLNALQGNRTLTSKKLGLDRKTLYRKLKAYGIDDSR